MNRDSRLWPYPLRQSACGWGKARPSHVDENRTAAAGYPGPHVMVDFNEKVVEAIAAPKPVAWFIGRPGHGVVIISVGGVLAPGGFTSNAAGWQRGARVPRSIRPPPQS